ncbi:hypothetical protein RCH09_002243 [Actimicrobium sp. GrIS 1.19]|uniref:hypothetical protein n=1 Tax=Actimicrobium sp. GrIS 1.19 TaxID=3071708 RepID=UPI002E03D064|nr:hypothetical protein [Actimicrobium sp. GrIS 1.19]
MSQGDRRSGTLPPKRFTIDTIRTASRLALRAASVFTISHEWNQGHPTSRDICAYLCRHSVAPVKVGAAVQ